eukprot:TRINITY_DN26055_c0_g1_i1.p1 TRINITY_DN26055_c0_g1~~TRINITY_DN26055_c0_g1_i1.p1  ORF type:complete len:183 (+),score=22.28 TRINITY_DN26055_c0_g1_i1:307-855(+)
MAAMTASLWYSRIDTGILPTLLDGSEEVALLSLSDPISPSLSPSTTTSVGVGTVSVTTSSFFSAPPPIASSAIVPPSSLVVSVSTSPSLVGVGGGVSFFFTGAAFFGFGLARIEGGTPTSSDPACACLTTQLKSSLVSHPVSYTHLRAHETPEHLVCRLLLEKKKTNHTKHSPHFSYHNITL